MSVLLCRLPPWPVVPGMSPDRPQPGFGALDTGPLPNLSCASYIAGQRLPQHDPRSEGQAALRTTPPCGGGSLLHPDKGKSR